MNSTYTRLHGATIKKYKDKNFVTPFLFLLSCSVEILNTSATAEHAFWRHEIAWRLKTSKSKVSYKYLIEIRFYTANSSPSYCLLFSSVFINFRWSEFVFFLPLGVYYKKNSVTKVVASLQFTLLQIECIRFHLTYVQPFCTYSVTTDNDKTVFITSLKSLLEQY